MTAIGFVLAAALGAVGRHLVVARVGRDAAGRGPWAVLGVNAAGSLLLGVLVGLRLDGSVSPGGLTVLGTGLCGALTTWSGFALDAASMADAGARPRALGYVGASVVLGLAAAGVGLAATGAL